MFTKSVFNKNVLIFILSYTFFFLLIILIIYALYQLNYFKFHPTVFLVGRRLIYLSPILFFMIYGRKISLERFISSAAVFISIFLLFNSLMTSTLAVVPYSDDGYHHTDIPKISFD
jgi:hypothetical protein